MYMTFQRRRRDRKQINGPQGLEWWENTKRQHEELWEVMRLYCILIVVVVNWIKHFMHVLKLIKLYAQKYMFLLYTHILHLIKKNFSNKKKKKKKGRVGFASTSCEARLKA